MFTGIIQEIGVIKNITPGDKALKLTINANSVLKDVRLGDSIAIDGVCLTVTKFNETEFWVDVMPESYAATTLKYLKVNSKVNLESAIQVGSHLGGHFVTGHVDGVGEITKITKNSNAIEYAIKLDENLLKYCVYKGSIAIDGTSLTIFGVNDNGIKLSLIPHTVDNSVLGSKNIGDSVNIENDMLAKYIEKLLPRVNTNNSVSPVNKEFLAKHDFL